MTETYRPDGRPLGYVDMPGSSPPPPRNNRLAKAAGSVFDQFETSTDPYERDRLGADITKARMEAVFGGPSRPKRPIETYRPDGKALGDHGMPDEAFAKAAAAHSQSVRNVRALEAARSTQPATRASESTPVPKGPEDRQRFMRTLHKAIAEGDTEFLVKAAAAIEDATGVKVSGPPKRRMMKSEDRKAVTDALQVATDAISAVADHVEQRSQGRMMKSQASPNTRARLVRGQPDGRRFTKAELNGDGTLRLS